jgi:hypothetical protein
VSPLLAALARGRITAGRRDRCHECGRRILRGRETGFVLLDDWRIDDVPVHRRCVDAPARRWRPAAGLLAALAAGSVTWLLAVLGLAVLLAETGAWHP